jgi:hypothetical protein
MRQDYQAEFIFTELMQKILHQPEKCYFLSEKLLIFNFLEEFYKNEIRI